MSYTVYAKARPVKTAFLLGELTDFNSFYDGLARWSTQFWGSRQSVVILLEKNSIIDDGWVELSDFDPDIIYLFSPISDQLLSELDTRLSPWEIKKPREHAHLNQPETRTNETQNPLRWVIESIQSAGVGVPPTEKNLKALRKPAIENNPLLLFYFSKDCPVLLRSFINRNFGTYEQWFDLKTGKPRHLGWLETLLQKVPVESIEHLPVSDLQSVCAAMERMSGTPPTRGWRPPAPFAAPCELSGIHLSKHYLAHGAFAYTYRVVVGSEPGDFIFYWRNCLNEGEGVWNEPFRHCLWIPSELIQEPAFVAALKNWLYRFTSQANSGSRTVELTSVSVSQDTLAQLANTLKMGMARIPTRLETVAKIEERWRSERLRPERQKVRKDLHRLSNVQRIDAVERKLTKELMPPEVIQEDVPLGTWAVDIQIEREPREGIIGTQDWWALPRRSGRSLVMSMFSAPARISHNGLFAIRSERFSLWANFITSPTLKLQLPADEYVLSGVLLNNRLSWEHSDARNQRLKIAPVVNSTNISDAGRKLRGLIELFGGFWRAQNYWERAFWRETFCRMAGRGAEYDGDFCSQTEKTILKELKTQLPSTPVQPDDIRVKISKRITRRVLGIVGERLPGIPMTFEEMEQERVRFELLHGDKSESGIQYVAGDTLVHMAGVEAVTSSDFQKGLEELVALDVLRMGMNVRCPRCRLQHWIKVDALRQSDPCPGCHSPMQLAPETPWVYSLNPLVHLCVNSRALAVWQALGMLAHSASSFFYTPSTEIQLVQTADGSLALNEIDVLCITHGELLIGEVKDGDVDGSDFEKLAAIAKILRPDRAAMFVPKDAKVEGWYKQFRDQLGPFGIRGELYQLPTY